MNTKFITCAGCTEGIKACENRPGWFTPSEAKQAIEAGLANKLMLDWWESDDEMPHIEIISPACKGSEGDSAPSWTFGPCAFLTSDKKCQLHDTGFKPTECRSFCCKVDKGNIHKETAKTWNSEEGKRVVELWKKAVNY